MWYISLCNLCGLIFSFDSVHGLMGDVTVAQSRNMKVVADIHTLVTV